MVMGSGVDSRPEGVAAGATLTLAARIAVGLMTMSAAGYATWEAGEGFTSSPTIPTVNDVPTVGFGSTRYEDGTRVTMSDPPISRERGRELARNLMRQEEAAFASTLPGVSLYQKEYDIYFDFTGQYGMTRWRGSSMRRNLLKGEYRAACDSLLAYKYSGGYDCTTLIDGVPNKRCWGVWTRQLDRHAACIEIGRAHV